MHKAGDSSCEESEVVSAAPVSVTSQYYETTVLNEQQLTTNAYIASGQIHFILQFTIKSIHSYNFTHKIKQIIRRKVSQTGTHTTGDMLFT